MTTCALWWLWETVPFSGALVLVLASLWTEHVVGRS